MALGRRLLDLIRLPERISRTGADIEKALRARTAELEKELHDTRADVRELRKEVRDRLLQYNLQLGRLSRNRPEDGENESRLSWREVPPDAIESRPLEWARVDGGDAAPDPEGREWLMLDSCPACGHAERTVVNEFNKLVLLDKAPDDSSARYDYAVCHACGITYATRRPVGSRFQFLLKHFGEVTGKAGGDGKIDDPLLNPYTLTDADRQHLKQLASRGVWVSEHLGLRKSEYLGGLLRDRFDNSVHLDLLSSLVAPHWNGRPAVILEIRPRAGTISEGLRRLFGADVHAMPIWESQQFLLKEVYGIESRGLIDYDEFEIPYDRTFDLIVCNHMLTHVIRPERFFDAVLRRLAPNGHLYLYNELDDAEILQAGQSMLTYFNPLHLQTFDQRSLTRALAARGLEVAFLKRRNYTHMCLARRGSPDWAPMTEKERTDRVRAYQRARDRAVIQLPPDLRGRFADEWPDLVARSVAEGLAEFDEKGRLRVVGQRASR